MDRVTDMDRVDGRRLRSWVYVGLAVVAVSLPGASADSIEEVRHPTGPQPTLALSDTTVRAEDVVELSVDGAGYTWDLETELQKPRLVYWETIYWWSTWTDSETIEPVAAGRRMVVLSIGFLGSGSFMIKIPDLAPGKYRIAKTFISGGTRLVEARSVTATVGFTLVG